jgi:hypothetical protein
MVSSNRGIHTREVAVLAISALILFSALFLTKSRNNLYGDGSDNLLKFLTGQVRCCEWRNVNALMRSAPGLIAVKFGMTNLADISLVYSLIYVLPPALMWIWAVWLSRKNNIAFLVTVAAAAFVSFTWLFSVSELVLGIPASVVISLIVIRTQPINQWLFYGGILATLLFLGNHEALIINSIIIGTQVVYRLSRSSQLRNRYFLIIILAIIVTNIGWSSYNLLFRRHHTADYFVQSLFSLTPQPVVFFFFLTLSLVVASILAVWINSFYWWYLVPIAVVFWILVIFVLSNFWNSPYFSYSGRAWAVVAGIGCLITYSIMTVTTDKCTQRSQPVKFNAAFKTSVNNKILVFCAAVSVLFIVPMGWSVSWHQALTEFRQTTNSLKNQYIDTTSRITSPSQRFLWGWSNASLSVVLRESTCSGILLPPVGWTPFDPETAHSQIPPAYVWGKPEVSRYCQTP